MCGHPAQALQARGFRVDIVTFGLLSFREQIAAVSDAAGLVGISGSDMVNAMFMPDGAALIEIFPLNRGVPIINPELYNVARMLGLTYQRYTSPINATLLYDADGKVIGDALLRQIDKVRAPLCERSEGATLFFDAALSRLLCCPCLMKCVSLPQGPAPRDEPG